MQAALSLLSFLERMTSEKFSGGVKIGFEDGKPLSISRSTNPDMSVPEVPEGFSLEQHIKKACTGKFYGTLFFAYSEGKLIRFHSNQTWQGRVLDEMLVRESESVGKKTRLVVVRK